MYKYYEKIYEIDENEVDIEKAKEIEKLIKTYEYKQEKLNKKVDLQFIKKIIEDKI